jgi:catalase
LLYKAAQALQHCATDLPSSARSNIALFRNTMSQPNSIDEQSKNQDLDDYRKGPNEQLTTNIGQKINSTDDSLKGGDRGPTLLEDFHFREKLATFDRERIPERVVHARGAGAHGYFQPYESMAEFTNTKSTRNRYK